MSVVFKVGEHEIRRTGVDDYEIVDDDGTILACIAMRRDNEPGISPEHLIAIAMNYMEVDTDNDVRRINVQNSERGELAHHYLDLARQALIYK